ncbi:hypothetical protein [Lactiplantibacillus plantarum]|uniref:hypothetical protein n=1 Tax=Lactiplantibacillus plantarum TaxID=1590 RepID=UPI0015EB8CD4|nr:hypothetical protein [Lactiplantibacillus plantarum]QLQ49186.1 hypothetical protein H0E85_10740 [Lactiplantibacillus plantarum]WDQ19895.1 hypothetical protein PTW40_09110 [Lactiplantibacillus plantarum]BEI53988.1 hypothetical protein AWA2045_21190 [Lactiplantibacillus plantarum]
MDKIEYLMSQYPELEFNFESMPQLMGGFTIGSQIIINSDLTESQQVQWLVEEIGHYKTSVGDISDYNKIESAKQEHLARNWGYKQVLSFNQLKAIRKNYVDSDYEVAENLDIDIEYLHDIGESYGLPYKHVK